MFKDYKAHVDIYGGKSRSLVYSASQSSIVNIDITVEREGEVAGEVVLRANENTYETLRSIKPRSHFAKVGYGEVYPVIIDDVERNVIKGDELVTLKVKGFKGYCELVDVYAYYFANESKLFTSDSKETQLIFYGRNTYALACAIMDNVHKTMRARGFEPPINYGNIYKKAKAQSNSYVHYRSYRLNLLEQTTLLDVFDEVFVDSGLSYDIHTSQNKDDKFEFVVDTMHTHDESNEKVTKSQVEVELSSPGKASVVYGVGSTFAGDKIVQVSKDDYSDSIYSSYGVDVGEVRSENLKNVIDRELKDKSMYTGSVRFDSFQELRVGQEVSLEEDIFLSAGTSRATVATKSISGRLYTYELTFAYESRIKPQNVARKVLLNKVDNVDKKAKRATKKKNSSSMRW